jgi:hypothetical protein
MSRAVDSIIDLILKPGASLRLVPVINVSVVLLMVVLISLLWNAIARIHLVVMGFLSLGLLISVNWVYYEYQKQVREHGEPVLSNDTNAIDPAIPLCASNKGPKSD